MIDTRWLGTIDYLEALEAQRSHRARILAGQAGDELWLLEHPSVITAGRRSVEDLPSDAVRTERGGLATWHGPGQLVGYLLCDVQKYGHGVRSTVCAIEQALIDWLATYEITAARRPGYPGVWVGSDKIAALGLHFRRGVSMHGFALNLRNDLDGFDRIVPCGITDGGVTTLRHRAGERAPSPEQAASSLGGIVVRHILDGGRSRG